MSTAYAHMHHYQDFIKLVVQMHIAVMFTDRNDFTLLHDSIQKLYYFIPIPGNVFNRIPVGCSTMVRYGTST